ncbi:MAG TPA: hypothetical protein P5137_07045, partial [Candidatus Brocadiia bacterium]|nr:hypothetical protein [Candidatus Brocadiia bacterium]
MRRIATASPLARIESFLRRRGARGATWGELALEFLFPAPASHAMWERVLRGALADTARFREIEPGRWALAEPAPQVEPGGFTAIETWSLPLASGREVALEARAERLDAAGASLGGASWIIKPLAPVPPGAWPAHLRGQSRQAVSWTQAVSAAAAMAEGTTLVWWRPGAFGAAVRRSLVERGCVAPELGLRRLARAVLGLGAARSREALASALGLAALDVATAQDAARAVGFPVAMKALS